VAEAKKYNVLPLDDLSVLDFTRLGYRVAVPASRKRTYYPGTTEIPEASAGRAAHHVPP
jgi:arylsulfatase